MEPSRMKAIEMRLLLMLADIFYENSVFVASMPLPNSCPIGDAGKGTVQLS